MILDGTIPVATDLFGGALYALNANGEPISAARAPTVAEVRAILSRATGLIEARGYLSAFDPHWDGLVDAPEGPLTLEEALLAAIGAGSADARVPYLGAEERLAGYREDRLDEEPDQDVESWDLSEESTTATTLALLRGAAQWPGWDYEQDGGAS